MMMMVNDDDGDGGGGKDTDVQHVHHNNHQIRLFECEDDLFEADHILETTRSTLSRLEDLWKELGEEYESELPLRLKDNSLSAIQIAAIRRVYAYNGADLEIIKVGVEGVKLKVKRRITCSC